MPRQKMNDGKFFVIEIFVRSALGKAEPLTATKWSRILDVASDLEETLDAADLEAIEFRDRLAAHKELLDRRRPVDIVDASVGESKEACVSCDRVWQRSLLRSALPSPSSRFG